MQAASQAIGRMSTERAPLFIDDMESPGAVPMRLLDGAQFQYPSLKQGLARAREAAPSLGQRSRPPARVRIARMESAVMLKVGAFY